MTTTMTDTLVWMDPPSPDNSRVRAAEALQIIEVLKQNPGRWARVHEAVSSAGAGDKFKRRGCEVTTRTNTTQRSKNGQPVFDIYARWPLAGAQAAAAATPAKPVQQKQAKRTSKPAQASSPKPVPAPTSEMVADGKEATEAPASKAHDDEPTEPAAEPAPEDAPEDAPVQDSEPPAPAPKVTRQGHAASTVGAPSPEDIAAALMAEAERYGITFPAGYDLLGTEGQMLARQRISMARERARRSQGRRR